MQICSGMLEFVGTKQNRLWSEREKDTNIATAEE